jgi:hypothetical protein
MFLFVFDLQRLYKWMFEVAPMVIYTHRMSIIFLNVIIVTGVYR